ncbi:MAG: hypothetical protein JKY37_22190 [Nannocystaceae bacterium]|nr:hypothetical protein [Nannocystaceae bacterium]
MRRTIPTLVLACSLLGACGDGPSQIESVSRVGDTFEVVFRGTLAEDGIGSRAFRVSIATFSDGSTTYHDPGYFYDAESFSCCDMECGAHNFVNTDCEHSDVGPPSCSSCVRTGPTGLMAYQPPVVEGNVLRLTLSDDLSDAACDELGSASTLMFVHYDGGEALTVDGEPVSPFGAEFIDASTRDDANVEEITMYWLRASGEFPLIERALAVPRC